MRERVDDLLTTERRGSQAGTVAGSKIFREGSRRALVRALVGVLRSAAPRADGMPISFRFFPKNRNRGADAAGPRFVASGDDNPAAVAASRGRRAGASGQNEDAELAAALQASREMTRGLTSNDEAAIDDIGDVRAAEEEAISLALEASLADAPKRVGEPGEDTERAIRLSLNEASPEVRAEASSVPGEDTARAIRNSLNNMSESLADDLSDMLAAEEEALAAAIAASLEDLKEREGGEAVELTPDEIAAADDELARQLHASPEAMAAAIASGMAPQLPRPEPSAVARARAKAAIARNPEGALARAKAAKERGSPSLAAQAGGAAKPALALDLDTPTALAAAAAANGGSVLDVTARNFTERTLTKALATAADEAGVSPRHAYVSPRSGKIRIRLSMGGGDAVVGAIELDGAVAEVSLPSVERAQTSTLRAGARGSAVRSRNRRAAPRRRLTRRRRQLCRLEGCTSESSLSF